MAKKKKAEEEEGDASLVLFTALSMILLAFFIMLYNMASPSDDRAAEAIDSLTGSFGALPGAVSQPGPGDHPSMLRGRGNSLEDMYGRLVHSLDTRPVQGVELRQDEHGRLILSFEEDLMFPSGGVRLNPRFFGLLDRVGDLMAEFEYPVMIEGHADSSAPSGGRSNWFYAAARAGMVHRYLSEACGVPHSLLYSHGFSSTRPDGSAEESRRVELIFVPRQARVIEEN